ncbi:Phosphorylase b kinase regulatory subunit beta, partial [Stegodyphus mimosarum]
MILHMKFLNPSPPPLESLSPSELRKVLYRVLTLAENGSNTKLSIHQRRQIEGALCRVPKNFYDRVWDIMTRTTEGIIVEGYHLPQQPTLTEMTVYDLKFATEVEMFLSRVALPEYRQILVELIMVVYLILERNPELSFNTTIDMNKLVEEAFIMFQKDNAYDREKDMTMFFDSPTTITASYLARAVMNHLLKCAPDQSYSRDLCVIS